MHRYNNILLLYTNANKCRCNGMWPSIMAPMRKLSLCSTSEDGSNVYQWAIKIYAYHRYAVQLTLSFSHQIYCRTGTVIPPWKRLCWSKISCSLMNNNCVLPHYIHTLIYQMMITRNYLAARCGTPTVGTVPRYGFNKKKTCCDSTDRQYHNLQTYMLAPNSCVG